MRDFLGMSEVFFFKQKTAYEIGLGIPAEPLFRSGHKAASNSSRTSEAALWPSTYISPLSNSTPCIRKDRISSKSLMRLSICLWKPSIGDRSEERRVGKECRSRWRS